MFHLVYKSKSLLHLKFVKCSLAAIMIWAILAVTFTGSIFLVHYLIPTQKIQSNIDKSLELIAERPNAPDIIFIKYFWSLDSFTDALIFNMARTADTGNPLDASLNNEYCEDHENSGYNFTDFKPGNRESATSNVVKYSRYWHGHQVLVRPLSLIFTYKGIAIINVVICIFLFVMAVMAIYRNLPPIYAIMFVVAMIITEFPFSAICLQYVPCFAISFLSIALLLGSPRLTQDYYRLGLSFFVVGAVTVFFDLLTFPLVTLCYPALMVCSVKKGNRLSYAVSAITGWICGYALLWATKWVIAYFVCNPESIADALQTASYRINAPSQLPLSVMALLIVNIIAIIYATYRSYRDNWRNVYILAIGWLPVLWYLILRNHSFLHSHFTWRTLFVTVFCLCIYFLRLYGNKQKHSDSHLMLQ